VTQPILPKESIKLWVKMKPEALQFPVLVYQKVPVEAQQPLLLVALPGDYKNLHINFVKNNIIAHTARQLM